VPQNSGRCKTCLNYIAESHLQKHEKDCYRCLICSRFYTDLGHSARCKRLQTRQSLIKEKLNKPTRTKLIKELLQAQVDENQRAVYARCKRLQKRQSRVKEKRSIKSGLGHLSQSPSEFIREMMKARVEQNRAASFQQDFQVVSVTDNQAIVPPDEQAVQQSDHQAAVQPDVNENQPEFGDHQLDNGEDFVVNEQVTDDTISIVSISSKFFDIPC